MKKLEINIFPLIISILLIIISLGIVLTSQYVFTTKHYIGICFLALSTIFYFAARKFYFSFFILTLITGLLGFLDFFITTYKFGFGGVGINPIFLGLIILLFFVSKKNMGILTSKNAHNSERKLNEILIKSYGKSYSGKTDSELMDIADTDSKYTDEAKFAANKILMSRKRQKK